ncbi:hypothetical protein FOZ60_013870 [Perkinsus olseni]|uniref:Uncharacterized protein n=2 Tax=Perkinsus olseni TaxID=32597 RepID=A0A7J6N909_PEROL|nr:hypothetical protein FOZ60_013870 [Perkinsus olseni]
MVGSYLRLRFSVSSICQHMSLYLFFFATLCGAVISQRPRLLSIDEVSSPLRNGRPEETITSAIGDLEHIQTLEVWSRSYAPGLPVTSLLVDPTGTKLIGTVATGFRQFVSFELQPTGGDRYSVPRATLYPMFPSRGNVVHFVTEMGLAVPGIYRGGDQEELIVTFSEGDGYSLPREPSIQRFPSGFKSTATTRLEMPDITRACPANTSIVGRPDIPLGTGPTAITTLNQRRRLRGSLLMFCDRPSPDPSIPKTDPQADVHLGLLYDGKNLARFHIESNDGFAPLNVAELNNGDVMIVFDRYFGDSIRIGYVTYRQLRRSGIRGRTLKPLIIAELSRSDGYNIRSGGSIAVRYDRSRRRTFVYIGTYDHSTRHTWLTSFEWKAKRGRSRR